MMKTHSYYLLALISTFAVLVRLIVIPILGSGNPADIYYVDREAAKLVLELRDPYLYSNYTNYHGQIVTFAYLPLIPIYYAPFVLIHLDIRYGSIAADVVSIVAMYFIVKSTLSKVEEQSLIPFSGSIAYAVLPTSIWLTSVAGTNMMIGSMFLVVALATLFEGRRLLSGIFLGLALATNQFVILALPLVALYCLRNRNFRSIAVSILIACAVILPFLLYSPSNFLYDVLLFQFERPMQQNGIWGLYYLVYTTAGFKMSTYLRLTIFLIPAAVTTLLFSRTKINMLTGVAILLALGAFILPVNGFWNYFLLPTIIICALIPTILTSRYRTNQPIADSSRNGL